MPLGVVRAVQTSSENSEGNPGLLETQPSFHAIKGARNSPGTRQLNPSRGVPSAAPQHPGERDRAQRPALGFGPQEPEQRTRGSQRRAQRGRNRTQPSRPVPKYLAAIQLTQLLHDPFLQHQPFPKLLTVVFHCHFSLLVTSLLLLHLPGSGHCGHWRRIFP